MSGIAHSPAPHHIGAFEPLRFAEFIERINRNEGNQRAAGRPDATAAGGEDCRCSRPAPAARISSAPRLGEVSPVARPSGIAPVRVAFVVTVQQLLPIGSIIDVLA